MGAEGLKGLGQRRGGTQSVLNKQAGRKGIVCNKDGYCLPFRIRGGYDKGLGWPSDDDARYIAPVLWACSGLGHRVLRLIGLPVQL